MLTVVFVFAYKSFDWIKAISVKIVKVLHRLGELY